MAHRWVVVILMILVFFSTIPLFMAVNKNFLPNDDESQFQVIVRVPEGANLATTQTILESVATQVRALGSDAHILYKPFSRDALCQLVEAKLDTSRAKRANA